MGAVGVGRRVRQVEPDPLPPPNTNLDQSKEGLRRYFGFLLILFKTEVNACKSAFKIRALP